MDTQEHSDQVMQKLTAIDRDLRSLRNTFGIVLIILTLLLAVAAPTLIKLMGGIGENGQNASTPQSLKQVPESARPPAPAAGTPAVSPATTTTRH